MANFKSVKLSFFLGALSWFMAIGIAAAQPATGEIEDAQIEIRKDLSIKLSEINKPIEKNLNPLSSEDKKSQNFEFKEFKLNLPDVESKVKVLTLRNEPLDMLYSTHIKGGFGNFLTSYLEAWHTSKRTNAIAYGVHFKHLVSANGPTDINRSGSGNNVLQAWNTYFGKKFTINTSLEYQRDRYNFFGYTTPNRVERKVSEDSLKQVFNSIQLNALINSNTPNALLQYDGGIKISNLTDRFEARETEFNFFATFNYQLKGGSKIIVNTDNAIMQRKDSNSQSRVLLKIRPAYQYKYKEYEVTAGINAALENDTLGGGGPIRVYPNVRVELPIKTGFLKAYGGVVGDMQKVSLRSLIAQNPWVGRNVTLAHTNERANFYAGIKGTLKTNFGFDASINYRLVNDFQLFVNNPSDNGRFLAIYDKGNTNILGTKVSAYYYTDNGFSVLGRIGYNVYNTDEVAKAWHLPQLETGLDINYLYKKKIGLKGSMASYSSMVAPAIDGTNAEVSLPAFVDIDLKLTYFFSKRGQAFILADNILGQENPRYLNYFTRGTLIMLGGGYSF